MNKVTREAGKDHREREFDLRNLIESNPTADLRSLIGPAKRKRTNSEEDPNEPASKSVKLDNDLTFEFLQQLKAIFPNVGHQFLSQKAEEFALLQEERGEGDSSLQEWVWEELSDGFNTFPTKDGALSADPRKIELGYTSRTLTLDRLFNVDDPMEATARMIEGHFLRMCQMYKERNVHEQRPDHRTWRIKKIELVENIYLKEKFETCKTEFASSGISDKAMLVYHGTMPNYAESICKFNLNVCNRKAHGAGFYFSEYPRVAFKFGKQLVVFKAMPGREDTGSDKNKHDGTEYHSKKIIYDGLSLKGRPVSQSKNNPDQHGEIIVIKNSDQFIPFAILHTEEVSVNASPQQSRQRMSDGNGPWKVYDFGFRHRRSIPSATGDSPWADSGSKTAQRRNSLPTPWPWASTGPNANAIGAAEYYSKLNHSTGSDGIGHSRSRF